MNSTKGRLIMMAAVALAVTACGGGGGGDSQDGVTPPPVGTAKTRIVTGTISGFGSIIVNGVHYDTSGADVRIEDRVGSVAELAVGQVVRIEATVDDRGGARAVHVEQHRLLQGTVQAVDAAAGTITVAGQVVIADDDTSFDDSIPGASLAGIAVGDRIEVHGFAGADGRSRSTRIERAGAGETEVEVTGFVTALDAAARRFRVGDLLVDYSSATLEDFGTAGPVNGDLVEVKGVEFLSDGALRAQRVDKEDGRDDDSSSGDESEIEGLVTRFASASDFDVAGRPVTTTAGTAYLGGTAANLGPNVKVEVEGTINASGVLVAAKVVFKRSGSVEISAPVEAVDAAAGTLRALGITVMVNSSTRVEDHEGDDQFFAFGDLRVGDWVEVRGYPDGSASGRVVATRLERDDAGDEVELRGPAGDLQQPRFRILGVAVETTPATEFEDSDQAIDAATFFARANGAIVDVEGSWDGASLTAGKAEIEHEGGTVSPPPPPPPGGGNTAPVARAGTARTVAPGTLVSLDASASSDAEGDTLTFAWTLMRPAGSAAVLSAATSATPSFTADVAGSYVATVTVSDGQASSSASVTITAQAPGSGLDGAALYQSNCSRCHGSITAIQMMPVSARNVPDIQRAIAANRGGMGSLSFLTAAELQAIVDAMAAANP
jgi:mono/diheme cytochrome c family protein